MVRKPWYSFTGVVEAPSRNLIAGGDTEGPAALSDGVFAMAMTLLALEPHGSRSRPSTARRRQCRSRADPLQADCLHANPTGRHAERGSDINSDTRVAISKPSFMHDPRSLTRRGPHVSDRTIMDLTSTATMAPLAPEAEQDSGAPREKWGAALDGGFQVLPDLLLRCQRELKLSSNDVVVLLHLTMAWWKRDRHPFPRSTTIARRMDVTDRTVQRSLERLRKSRLIYKKTQKVEVGQTRIVYDLTPLADRLIDISRTDPLCERRREIRAGEAGAHTQPPARAQ